MSPKGEYTLQNITVYTRKKIPSMQTTKKSIKYQPWDDQEGPCLPFFSQLEGLDQEWGCPLMGKSHL
jgi:hypothetical protein